MAELRFIPPPSVRSQGKEGSRTGSASAKKDSIWNREISISSGFDAKQRLHLFQMLAVLLNSGLSITESLEVIMAQVGKRKALEIIGGMLKHLEEGKSLSEAFAAQPKYFSSFEVHSIRMGEKAGVVPQVLQDLASLQEKRQKLQRKFMQAISYPIVVVVIASAVLFFMVNYVVPMFSDIFLRFDAELPRITQMVIGMSEFSTQNGWWIGLLLLGTVAGIYSLRKHPKLQQVSSTISGKLPLIGRVVQKIQLSRFCYTLALMLRSKLSLDQALELLEQIISYHPIKRELPAIRQAVVEGRSLHEAMAGLAVFPPIVGQMVKVGEKTAKLDKMLENLGKNLEEEGEAGIGMLTSLLEPIMIVVLGLMVGTILVSMYLPMFELSNTIGG